MHPMINIEISNPDAYGECSIKAKIKTDEHDTGASYRLVDCGTVKIKTPKTKLRKTSTDKKKRAQ